MFFFNFLEYDDSGSVFDSEAGYGLDVGQPEFGIVRVLRLDPGQSNFQKKRKFWSSEDSVNIILIFIQNNLS